jgi:hypothetical protein
MTTKSKTAKDTGNVMSKMTANEKLNFLTNQLGRLNQVVAMLGRENQELKLALTQLDKRVLAMLRAGDAGAITTNAVKNIMVDDAASQMESTVSKFVEQGLLARNDQEIIGEDSFIVGRELDKEGNVSNPRVQIIVKDADEKVKTALIGSKVGAVIPSALIDDLDLEILENYLIVNQEAKQEEAKTENKEG